MAQTFSPADGRVRSALDQIMRARKVSSSELGRRLNVDRHVVDKRRTSTTPISAGLLEEMAAKLEVPIFLFYENAAEIHRWFAAEAENGPSDLGSDSSVWFTADEMTAPFEFAEVA